MAELPSKLLSRRDLEFLLYEWLQVESLTQSTRHADHSRETFDAALDTSERIATELFAPHYQSSDANEPHLVDGQVQLVDDVQPALKAFGEAGLVAATKDYDLGGMQLPTVVSHAGMAYFYAANISTAAYPLLSMANANLLLEHGNAAQIETFVRPELEGRYYGTMCLSEPQAGSSLSDITTRADYEGESALGEQYRISGNKMWISAGDHELSDNIVHLVLAKIPDENGKLIPGVKGISLLLVPRFLVNADGSRGERNDVSVAGLNHKMGYRGTVNCLLNFGEGRHQPGGHSGAIGYLVGEKHRGLSCMFHMMNEARIGVGLAATALGYTGYLHALDYARNRPQGRAMDAQGKDPSSPQRPIIEHADVKRMLLAQKAYAEGALALNLYCAHLLDQASLSESAVDRKALTLLLDILTPIAKSWPSQWCLAGNDLAIQIHGGYGYTRDYKVEQFYRDNRLNAIHEGTHGIQGLDLLGRKVVMADGAAMKLYAQRVSETAQRAATEPALSDFAQSLGAKLKRLIEVTQSIWGAGDPRVSLANATTYLEAFGHLTIAWIWLDQLRAIADKHGDFYAGKRAAATYFYRYELPKIEPQLALLESLDRTTLDVRDEWF